MSNQQQNLNAQHAHMRPTLSSQNPYSVPVPFTGPYSPSPSTPYYTPPHYTPSQASTMTTGTPTYVQTATTTPPISSGRRILHLLVALLRMFFRPTLATFKQEVQWAHWGMTWLLLTSVIVLPAFFEIVTNIFFPPRYYYGYPDFSIAMFFIGFIMELALFFFYTLIQYISSGDMQTGNTVVNGVAKEKRFAALCYSVICIALPFGLIFTTMVTSGSTGIFSNSGYFGGRTEFLWIGLAISAISGLYGLFLNIQAIRAIYGFNWLRATIVTLTPLISAFILVGGYAVVWRIMNSFY